MLNGAACPLGYIRVALRGQQPLCLALATTSSSAALLAAAFEPSRYAAMRGATMDVFNFAGMSYRARTRDGFYLAAPHIAGGGGTSLAAEPNACGCVFDVSLDGSNIARSLKAFACGEYNAGTEGGGDVDNSLCNTAKLAKPNTLTWVPEWCAR